MTPNSMIRLGLALLLAAPALAQAQRSTPVTVVNGDANPVPVTVMTQALPESTTRISVCIDGITGTETTIGYEDCVRAGALGFSVANPVTSGTGAPGGSSRATFSDVTIRKQPDISSPPLFLAVARGTEIANVEIFVYDVGNPGLAFLRLRLEDVIVTGLEAAADDTFSEKVSFSYARVTLTSTPANPDGSPGPAVEAGWNVETNSPL